MRVSTKIVLLFTAFSAVAWSATGQNGVDSSGQPLSATAWLVPTEPPLRNPAQQASSAPSRSNSSLTGTSFRLHHEGDALLLHLTDKRNHVTLRVTDLTGKVVQTDARINVSGGFYEIPLANGPTVPTLYVLKLIINQEVVTFRATL